MLWLCQSLLVCLQARKGGNVHSTAPGKGMCYSSSCSPVRVGEAESEAGEGRVLQAPRESQAQAGAGIHVLPSSHSHLGEGAQCYLGVGTGHPCPLPWPWQVAVAGPSSSPSSCTHPSFPSSGSRHSPACPAFLLLKCQEHLQFLSSVKEHLSFAWSSSRSCLRDASLGF